MILRSPFLVLLLLGVVWGTGYSLARYAMTHAVPPLGYSFWQALGPAILLTLFLFLSPKKFQVTVKSSILTYFFIAGLTGIVIPNTIIYFVSEHLPAGLLAVISNLVPMIAFPLALIANLESFSWQRLIAVLFAILGLMLLVLPKTSLPSASQVPWVFVGLATPFFFAFSAVYVARFRPQNIDTIYLAAFTLIMASVILLPLIIFQHAFYLFHWPLASQDIAILMEIILSSVGYFLFFHLLKIAGPVYYSLVDTIVALTGLAWGYIIFQERLNHWTGPAVVFIVMGLLVNSWRTSRIR